MCADMVVSVPRRKKEPHPVVSYAMLVVVSFDRTFFTFLNWEHLQFNYSRVEDFVSPQLCGGCYTTLKFEVVKVST